MSNLKTVADAMAESFKARVAESAGEPFEATKVVLPTREVWERYAKDVLLALGLAL